MNSLAWFIIGFESALIIVALSKHRHKVPLKKIKSSQLSRVRFWFEDMKRKEKK